MSNEITNEVLAKAIDATKAIVQTEEVKVTLVINNKDVNYKIVNKQASGEDSQLNTTAIAPMFNRKK